MATSLEMLRTAPIFTYFYSKSYTSTVINPPFPLSWIAVQSRCHVMHSPEPGSTLLNGALLTFNLYKILFQEENNELPNCGITC